MPDFTIASAVCRMRSSLTLHANLFQLFHPIGGVGARLLAEILLSWARRVPPTDVKARIINRPRIVALAAFFFISASCSRQVRQRVPGASMLWRKSCVVPVHDFHELQINLA